MISFDTNLLLYLLRNPALLREPLEAADAVSLVQTFRRHPTWDLIDYPGGDSRVMEEI
jgi:hypothetical protein